MLASKSKAEVITWDHLVFKGTFVGCHSSGLPLSSCGERPGMLPNTCSAQASPVNTEGSKPNVSSGRLGNGSQES